MSDPHARLDLLAGLHAELYRFVPIVTFALGDLLSIGFGLSNAEEKRVGEVISCDFSSLQSLGRI